MARKKKELPLLNNVLISNIAAEGKSIARVRLKDSDESPTVVFIPYGAPGDIADIKIDKKKRNYAEGHIEKLRTPSELRVDPVCEYFGTCGGCKWQHIPYSEQLKFKTEQVKDALSRIGKLDFPQIKPALGSTNDFYYRNKMEYTFSNKKWRSWEEIREGKEFTDSSNALGFHIPGSFDKVLHIEKCFLQNTLADRIRNFIFDYAQRNGLTFFNIKENKGLLRTLMTRNSSTGQLMVCVCFGEKNPEVIENLLTAIKEKFPEITSLLYVINLKLNDSIADQEVITFHGLPYIEEEMEGLKFRIHAKSFYQTNSLQAYRLYETARRFAGLSDMIEGNKPVVYDLYTGAGTIANFVARNARKVIGIEYVKEAIEDAVVNSKINDIDNTEFFAGDMKDILTEEFVNLHGKPDIMIIDPPRAGMHEDVIQVIKKVSPATVVYVSCNPATQARDLALMADKYEIMEVQPVDMFPQTHHIENVVKLKLKD